MNTSPDFSILRGVTVGSAFLEHPHGVIVPVLDEVRGFTGIQIDTQTRLGADSFKNDLPPRMLLLADLHPLPTGSKDPGEVYKALTRRLILTENRVLPITMLDTHGRDKQRVLEILKRYGITNKDLEERRVSVINLNGDPLKDSLPLAKALVSLQSARENNRQ